MSLLCPEQPLTLSATLAEVLQSAEAAIVIQQIHYWLTKECGKVINNVRWIYNTYAQWLEQFPWMSEWKLRKIFYQLRELKVIKFEQHDKKKYNRKGYYTIDYECLKALHTSKCEGAEDQSAGEQAIDVCNAHTLDETETSSKISTETTTSTAVEKKEVEEQQHEEPTERESNVVDDKGSPPVCSGVDDGVLHPLDNVITENSSTPGITEERDCPAPTVEEVREIETELRNLPLTGGFKLNNTIRAQIKKNFHRAKSTVAQMKEAVRTWKVRPDYNWQGQCVAFLKGTDTERLPKKALKQICFPEPTSEQLEQLAASGEKLDRIATPNNVGGFQEVLYVIRPFKSPIAWWNF